MRKASALALLTALALPLTTNRAEAQFSFMPYLGYNTEDFFGFLVGVGAEFDAPFALGNLALGIQPGVEYVFAEGDATVLQIDGNVVAKFGAPGASITPYAGAGLGIIFVSPDEGDSNSELGLNLLGGAIFNGALAFGNPYIQARYSLIDPLEALSIMGGLRIPLGAN